jgi:ABC-type xylose transport system permease subunit
VLRPNSERGATEPRTTFVVSLFQGTGVGGQILALSVVVAVFAIGTRGRYLSWPNIEVILRLAGIPAILAIDGSWASSNKSMATGSLKSAVYLAFLFLLVFYLVLRFTSVGRKIFYIGSSIKMSWLSGIEIGQTRNIAFMLSGLGASIAGDLDIVGPIWRRLGGWSGLCLEIDCGGGGGRHRPYRRQGSDYASWTQWSRSNLTK